MARLKNLSLVNKMNTLSLTALHAAAAHGYEAMVRLLLLNGARVDEPSRDEGITPIYLAVRWGYNGIVQILLDAGVDVNKPGRKVTPLLYYAAILGHEAVVETLLDKGYVFSGH